MHVLPVFSFSITLTRDELRIVGLALAGRLTSKTDVVQAQELNVKLLEHRRRLLLEEVDLVEGALEKIQDKDK